MNIENVWSVYFTGTGNTKKVVNMAARSACYRLKNFYEEYDFSLPQAREKVLEFGENDLVFVGVPTYAGRVPNVLLPFLKENLKGNGALAVPIVTFGNRNYDDSLLELRNILEQNGFHTLVAGAFVGEHSFSTTLGAGRPSEEDLSLAMMLGFKASERIADDELHPESPVHVNKEDVTKPAVVNDEDIHPYYTPRDSKGNKINILKVKPLTDMDKCVKCGLCAEICTMGSIDPQDVSQVTGVCIKCCACVKRCPQGAKYYDNQGYLYHKEELEKMYARKAETRLYLV